MEVRERQRGSIEYCHLVVFSHPGFAMPWETGRQVGELLRDCIGDFVLGGGTESSKYLFHLRTGHASATDAFRRAEMLDCGQQSLDPGAPARSPAILEDDSFRHV